MFEEYRINGKRVVATITQPNKSLRLLGPVNTLVHLPLRLKVVDGSVLYEKDEPRYLIAHHHKTLLSLVCAAIEITTEVELTESTTTTNPVTKMQESRVVGLPRKVFASEHLVTAAEVVGLKLPETIYFLGEEVTPNHFINGRRVRFVSKVTGLYRVEVA